ncbi:NUDIX hydrolase [Methylobacterium nodulans]|uniref:NUDIX hydrolase n=1 Tax=Methylobacterium nodulans TaxID=114616 RepID=UPI003137BD25
MKLKKKPQAKAAVKKALFPKLLKQVAALPIRLTQDIGLEVLLVTSRETKRWVVPKGWPMKGMKGHEAAAIEAREEAGVIGRISKKPAGYYTYDKRQPDGRTDPCRVAVYVLTVTEQLETWREKGQREMQWVGSEAATVLLQEPELASLIRDLARPATWPGTAPSLARKARAGPVVENKIVDARVEISVVKSGKTLSSEVVISPSKTDMATAVARLCLKVQETQSGPLWPFQVVVREAD